MKGSYKSQFQVIQSESSFSTGALTAIGNGLSLMCCPWWWAGSWSHTGPVLFSFKGVEKLAAVGETSIQILDIHLGESSHVNLCPSEQVPIINNIAWTYT